MQADVDHAQGRVAVKLVAVRVFDALEERLLQRSLGRLGTSGDKVQRDLRALSDPPLLDRAWQLRRQGGGSGGEGGALGGGEGGGAHGGGGDGGRDGDEGGMGGGAGGGGGCKGGGGGVTGVLIGLSGSSCPPSRL